MYKIVAALGLLVGSALIVGYATHPEDGNAKLAVAGVLAVIVGVLSMLAARDSSKASR